MRFITLAILLTCASNAHAQAQSAAAYLAANGVGNLGAINGGNLYPNEIVPVAPPFGPALPIPQGSYAGPWGTGYPNHTYKRTVTSILPNDALGQPMQGPSLNFLP